MENPIELKPKNRLKSTNHDFQILASEMIFNQMALKCYLKHCENTSTWSTSIIFTQSHHEKTPHPDFSTPGRYSDWPSRGRSTSALECQAPWVRSVGSWSKVQLGTASIMYIYIYALGTQSRKKRRVSGKTWGFWQKPKVFQTNTKIRG
jgi:hypothetical protein